MTDEQIARAYPHLSEAMGRVALLGESMNMARDLAAARQEIAEAGQNHEKLNEIFASRGTLAEIMIAEQTTNRYIIYALASVSEQDLKEGREKGLLTPEDYREALKAMRTMGLQRDRDAGRDRDRERE